MLLGHQIYLKAKAVGDNSISGKAGCSETAKLHVCQGPDGMVKAELLEPKCPYSKPYWSETADKIRHPLKVWLNRRQTGRTEEVHFGPKALQGD